MATLTGNSIASTYTGLLSVSGAVGADTVEAVTDGAGTSTSLSLSQQRATITLGSGAGDDFIVDGTTLVVEGDNNRVGIGTASPDQALDVNGHITIKDNGFIYDKTGNPRIKFWEPGSNSYYAGTSGGDHVFYANDNTHLMTIDSSGNVLVGVTSTTLTGGSLTLPNSGIIAFHDAGGNARNTLQFVSGELKHGAAGGGLTSQTFFTSATERMRIDSSGNVTVSTGNLVIGTHGKGIDFSANTDDATPDSGGEVLDDYEEGTWTPMITDGSNNATMSGTYNRGYYTKIGRQVTVTGYIVSTGLGSVSGDIKISGLPFTVANAFNAINGAAIGTIAGLAITAGHSITAQISINTTTAGLNVTDATTGTTPMQHSEWTDDGTIGFSMTYFA